MKKDLTNYAFIDSQNINLGIQELGWKLDWKEFRRHLMRNTQLPPPISLLVKLHNTKTSTVCSKRPALC